MKIKTSWDFEIFKKENFLKERNLVLKKIESFYNKWSKENLRKPQNLLKFLKDYEKLLSTPPGIFSKEYLYYFLKSLLDTKNKKYKEKLEEVRRLQEDYYEPLLIKGFDHQIMKIIKRGVLENKENFRKEMKEYEAQKEKIDSLFSQKISLNEAIHLAIEIFNKIDKSFGKFVLNSFQKGLVDVYPRKNKYLLPRVASVTRIKFLPTFILLNYSNTLQDFLSLIHEFAHSLHNEFLKKYNSSLNSAQVEIIKETVTAIFVLFALETLKEKYDRELIEKKIKGEGAQRILYDMSVFSTQEEIYKIFKKKGKVKIKEINKIYKKNVSLFL
jgi:oligoendopeptidase F